MGCSSLLDQYYVEADGKPSTWFPPEGLVEQSYLQEQAKSNKQKNERTHTNAQAREQTISNRRARMNTPAHTHTHKQPNAHTSTEPNGHANKQIKPNEQTKEGTSVICLSVSVLSICLHLSISV